MYDRGSILSVDVAVSFSLSSNSTLRDSRLYIEYIACEVIFQLKNIT
jgi:hypothetical protein